MSERLYSGGSGSSDLQLCTTPLNAEPLILYAGNGCEDGAAYLTVAMAEGLRDALSAWLAGRIEDTAAPPSETFNAITDWRDPVPGWETVTEKQDGSAIITRHYTYPAS